MIIHTFNTYHFVSCINIILILIYNCYNEDVYLPMELYYLCIDFVFQFIVEKYRNKLNQIKSRALQGWQCQRLWEQQRIGRDGDDSWKPQHRTTRYLTLWSYMYMSRYLSISREINILLCYRTPCNYDSVLKTLYMYTLRHTWLFSAHDL